MRRRLVVLAYVVVGLGLVVGYRWVHSDYAYWGIALYGAAGTVAGACRMPAGRRRPWLFMAAGVVLWVLGDLEWDIEAALGRSPTSPDVSDAFYFVAYPLVAIGLLQLVRSVARTTAGTAIDSAVFGVMLASALWPLLFASVTGSNGESLAERLTMGVYPCWDIVFVVLGARIALMRPFETRRTVVLLAAVGALFVGDLFWADSTETYVLGDWMDYGWLAGYLGFGVAALLPASPRRQETETVSALRRFLVLALPVMVVPAVVVIETVLGHRFSVVDALLMFALLLLVLLRLGIVIRGLESARAELRDQNRLKDELISVVSHDLRTPLTSIMGYLELVAEEKDPETAKQFLDVVQRNTGRLHRLVEDLLFVSRVQSGREALELGPVCLGDLVRETVAASLPAADGSDVELTCTVETDDVVLLDAHRVAEVLENLLSNAVKFTPPGGRVAVFAGKEAGASLLLRVEDSGVGIADEDREHLFDRFFRASGADGIPGAGLGLSIVKAIVDAHGGEVAVSSVVGAGTTFDVRLPIHVAETAEPVAA
jgi:signal transduction histidine kinase